MDSKVEEVVLLRSNRFCAALGHALSGFALSAVFLFLGGAAGRDLAEISLSLSALAIAYTMLFVRDGASSLTVSDPPLSANCEPTLDVSIISPVYNRPDDIQRLLERLREILDGHPLAMHSEVIVVDDGSTDETAAVVKQMIPTMPVSTRLLSTRNRGVASARNTGFRAAKGAVVLSIDSDAVPDEDWFDAMCKATQTADAVFVRAKSDRRPWYPLEVSPDGARFAGVSFGMRRDDYLTIGGMCEQFGHHLEDSDFYLKLISNGLNVRYADGTAVWHPLRTQSLAAVWRQGIRHRYDALLLKRHGFRARPFLKNIFMLVNVGPYYGLTFALFNLLVTALVALCIPFADVRLHVLLALGKCATILVVFYGVFALAAALYLRVPLFVWPKFVSGIALTVISSIWGRIIGTRS